MVAKVANIFRKKSELIDKKKSISKTIYSIGIQKFVYLAIGYCLSISFLCLTLLFVIKTIITNIKEAFMSKIS